MTGAVFLTVCWERPSSTARRHLGYLAYGEREGPFRQGYLAYGEREGPFGHVQDHPILSLILRTCCLWFFHFHSGCRHRQACLVPFQHARPESFDRTRELNQSQAEHGRARALSEPFRNRREDAAILKTFASVQ
ncbi:hypothetical protein PAL_GLEAN10004457 [Pteropus alecto]|uniref:Uncharacterized protein n=1 Tax=Pteropus alecto TaxID=9402 RepID=L5L607_PTEAL|nr:hypothetical protein PAL_GLEAN10004457 [Pteropus alecto]